MAPNPLHAVSQILADFSQLQLSDVFAAPPLVSSQLSNCGPHNSIPPDTFVVRCDVS